MNRRQFIIGTVASLAALPLLGAEDKAKYKMSVDLATGKDKSAVVLTFGTVNGAIEDPIHIPCSEIVCAELSEDKETAYFYRESKERTRRVHGTVEVIEDSLYLDFDHNGRVCGIETLDKETTRAIWNANCLDKGLDSLI